MARFSWRAAARWLRRVRRRREIRAGKAVLKSPPAQINIELSGRCNVWPPCTYCVGKNAPGYREPPHIGAEQFEGYWEHLLAADRVNDCTYGEPLMHPGIHDLIDRLGRAGVKFGFTTNGLLLNEKKARLLARHGGHIDICVSVNAASKEVYFAHQGKDFDTLIGNIDRFVTLHRRTRPGAYVPMVLSFIVMRSNQHEVMDFVRLGRRLGVRALLFRHLFDMGVGDYTVNNFGHRFVYAEEMLGYPEYQEIERRVRESAEFRDAGVEIYFGWNGKDSFIKEQSEPGVDIPCLFPWKFLCIRPIHNIYTPCVYLKKGIARTDEMTVAEVWNGEVMQEMRRSLAKGEVPKFCRENSDICPLVLEERQKQPAPAAAAGRTVNLPVLKGA